MGNFMTKMMTNMVIDAGTNMATRAVKSAAVGMTASLIAKTLGLDDSLVGRVLMVGAPMTVALLADDRKASNTLFNRSSKRKKDKKKAASKGRKEDENTFFEVFGPKGKAMNKAIAEETGASEEDVNGIMGMFLVGFENEIDEADVEDEEGLFRLFGDEGKEAKKQPSVARMMTKMIF